MVVVGAGISGATCARTLHDAGVAVRLVDRGRRVGGRLGARRLGPYGDRRTDLGGSYLTVDHPDLQAQVDDWERRGLARRWTDTFLALSPDAPAESKAGPVRWASPVALRSLVEDLADPVPTDGHAVADVTRGRDGRLAVDGQPAAGVVLAMPDPQARRLLGDGLPEAAAALAPAAAPRPRGDGREGHVVHDGWEPIIAVAAWWPERTWDAVSPHGHFEGAFVNDDPVLSWVADDGRRHGDDVPLLVAHSTPDHAAEHLVDPPSAAPAMLAALADRLGVGDPVGHHVHRWSVARPSHTREAAYHLGDGLVGVCGDAWGGAPKVQTAYLSGLELGRRLVAELT
ncbi:MAG: NAD/FAD-dependent oxidoreductase [Nocardioides sp.]|nr:NAD/FAD-dependent oxidoreductase [Nocardioides sp.]